jgi:hypothetical protein
MREKFTENNAFQNVKLISFNLWNPHENSLKIIAMSCFSIIIVRETQLKNKFLIVQYLTFRIFIDIIKDILFIANLNFDQIIH